jgi:hypothetical protein
VFPQENNNNCTIVSSKLVLGQKNPMFQSRSLESYFNNYSESIGQTLTSPLRWKTEDFVKLGGFFVLTAGSFLLENEVKNIFSKNRNKTLDDLEPVGYYYGSPLTTVPATLAIYLSGVIFNNNWLRDTGLMLAETITIIAIIQVPSSFIFGRTRPHSTDNNLEFNFFDGFKQENASFISGHTAIAFGISNILSYQINNPIATVGLYGLAAVTPLARLYDNQHWFSDIFMGAAIGLFVSNKIININASGKKNKKSLSFFPAKNGIGVMYVF